MSPSQSGAMSNAPRGGPGVPDRGGPGTPSDRGARRRGDYSSFTDVFGSVRDARAVISQLRLPTDLAQRASLVVTELATNAVLHAGGVVCVRIWCGDNRLRLEVSDRSGTLPAPGTPGNMSGRGLQIVAALSDTWGSIPKAEGKVVWAELAHWG